MAITAENRTTFYFVAISSQLLALGIAVQAGFYFVDAWGTPDWTKNIGAYHPLLLVIAFVWCQGEAIVVYRLYRYVRKIFLKWAHCVLHIMALALAFTGFSAMVINEGKRESPTHFDNPHSWMGLILLFLYACQFFVGFVSFLFPGLPNHVRAWLMPTHKFFGLMLFMFTMAQVIGGLQSFGEPGGPDCKATHWCTLRWLSNFLIPELLFYSMAVVYLLVTPEFKRDPLPEDH